jgi:hemerythrin
MALVEWREEFRIGHPSLDFEHKDLLEHISELYDQCQSRLDPEHVENCMGKVHARLSAHFALEEELMREWKNPHYEDHKEVHEEFLDEVLETMAHVGPEIDEEVIRTFARRLRDWLVDHITTYDRKLTTTSRPF